MSTDFWIAFGSVATAIAVIVAFWAITQNRIAQRKEHKAELLGKIADWVIDIKNCPLRDIPFVKDITEEDKLYSLQAKYIADLSEDIDQIVKLIKSSPQKIHIYINADWKNDLYETAQEIFKDEAVKIGKIMNAAKENKKLNEYMNDIANEVKQMLKDPTMFRIEMLSTENQKKAIEGYKYFISRSFSNAEILIHMADDRDIFDPQNKAQKARPMKPALLLE